MMHIIGPSTHPYTFCGKQHKEGLTDWYRPHEQDCIKHDKSNVCEDCLNSPDYALYMLATVGEPKDPFAGIDSMINKQGTITGRISASDIATSMQKLQKEAYDYAKLERRVAAQLAVMSPEDFELLKTIIGAKK